VRADEDIIRPPVKVAIFRILQEACSNACKHSGARRLSVLLETDAEGVRLEVADDGVGFSPASVRHSSTGLGLASMRERATLTNGCLAIGSRPGAGTCILGTWCAEEVRATCPHEDGDRAGDPSTGAATCPRRVFSLDPRLQAGRA
jgi:signal transduction histidine kinase